MEKKQNLNFGYRLKMVGIILVLILAMMLFTIFILTIWIFMAIPMLVSKRIFIRYTYFFITRTKINNPSENESIKDII